MLLWYVSKNKENRVTIFGPRNILMAWFVDMTSNKNIDR